MLAVCAFAQLSLGAEPEFQAAHNKQTSNLLDYTIKFPEELDAPYSLDDPPCKTFTDEQKRRQIVDGERILAEILAA